MSDIFEEIQKLQEQFNNLFEVEGLGDPAVDVPPSQNKIKRDRKTKDGKVEVVSVEDELFPYEGNKREQFRQKIIDTINKMIQGQATLEDLLQIVRQKKAPLKEAMELLEDIHAMIDKHGDKIGPKSELHDLMRSHQYDAAIQYGEEKGKPIGKRWQDEQDFEDRRSGEDTKNYKGQRKTTEKQFKGFGTVTVGGADPSELEKKIRREHARRDGKPVQDYPFDGDIEDYTSDGSKPQKIIDKSIVRHEKKEQKKAPLKEAMELMENLIFEKNANVRKKHEAEIKKAEENRPRPEIENYLHSVEGIKNFNERTIRDLSKYKTGNKNKDQSIDNAIYAISSRTRDALGRKVYPENPYKESFVSGGKYPELHGNLEQKEYELQGMGGYHPSQNERRKELIRTNIERSKKLKPNLPEAQGALLEVMEVAEAIINEVSNKTVEKALNHAGDKVELSTMGILPPEKKYVDQYKRLQELADKRAKKYSERIEQDPDTGWHKHVKEAFDLMEAIINELSPKALDKRTDKSIEADEQDRKEFNDILNIEDRDKRAKAYKEFKKKSDDRFNKENEKLDLYAKWAKKHSKALGEAIEIMEAIKDEVKNHHKYMDGSATFSYKGHDYSYSPKKGILGGLRKEGKTRDDSNNPVKKAVDSSNKEFEKARKYNYDLDRQARTVGKKLNKEVAKLEKKEGKGTFPSKTNDTIKKLVDTVNVIKANKADADKNFTEINKRQQNMADDAKGVKHQMYDVWTSKKGDNFGWKPVVKASEAFEGTISLIEALQDQIDKKLKKGEINLDKALQLDKKIEDKMSQEKNNQERQDKIQKDAWEIGPNLEKAAQQRQIGKSIRRNQRKNALTFEDLEEAFKLLEDLRSKIQEQPEEKKAHLENKYAKVKSTFQRLWDQRKAMSKAEKGQEKNNERTEKAFKKFILSGGEYPTLGEAIDLMEAIINEVSVGALARATENNAAKRKETAKKSEENAHKAWASYDKLSQEHPEDESTLYNAATKLGKVAYKDEQRKEHVEDLEKLNLPKDSKVSANKLFKAADKSYDKRADEYSKLLDSGESHGKSYKETKESRPAKRYTRAARIGFAEPVKSRAHEALEEAMTLILELFDRPDLLNDIDTALGSPVKNVLKKFRNSLTQPKKEKKVKVKK